MVAARRHGDRRRGDRTAPVVEINPAFARALERMESGERNLFVTGKAGTGKSTLLEYFRANTSRDPVLLAPTGVAALNVGGQTIHRFFGFGIDTTPEKVRASRSKPRHPELYRKLATVVIDEVSMLRADLLDCVDLFLRKHGPKRRAPFGGVHMVFVGDLYQLPPVVTGNERTIFHTVYDTPYFFSARSLANADLEIVELEKVYRQTDAEFVELLNRIRNDSVTADDLDRLNARLDPGLDSRDEVFQVTLTTTNRNADRINEAKLASLPGKTLVSRADVAGDFGREYYPTASDLAFKEGAQIMMLNNDAAGRWVNGSIGTVESEERDEDGDDFLFVRLRDGDDLVEVRPHTWDLVRFVLADGRIVSEPVGYFTQLPFRLAWAVTIHKSQGKTFDRIVVDLERGAFATGQTYVALSRCTTFEGIVLRRPIAKSSIRADWRIRQFLTGYHYRRSEEAMPAEEKAAAIRRAIEAGGEVAMTYLKADDTRSERVVVPLSVGPESYMGKHFLGMRAFCPLRGEERMFRVDRILELEVRT